ncbi:Inactive tetrahydrocannabinolic acid synthase [Dichanthelium oligosanthes]|uniref:Inactive tetrahydrocannabinolic acid synthase n=1 Tax=Dichanthelium oligosanthes TaxID=888268 RepID=A0A1E5VRJ8_9POAL|nr:Inactive tetrahydrocannabinolic acid synthase [Dichanthelium oligosanthes]
MATSTDMARILLILCFLCCDVFVPSFAASDDFLQCLSTSIPSELVYQQSSSSFMSVLQSSVQNPKYVTNTTVRPLCIVTASDVSHVQAAVRCGRWHGVRLRVRSGGHDYEGLSYRSVRPEVFALLDLSRLRAVGVHPGEATAWVDAGATLGELYYAVGMANPRFAFPGGACPTVGISGYLSGGGIGLMMRRYGIGADNVIDARIVNADGDVIDSVASMDQDLFWAIRGGGGESFGVVVAWRLRLSMVQDTVTVVNVQRTLDEGAAAIVAKWETLILQPFLPDLTIRVVVQDRHAFFQTLFLGRCSRLLQTMRAFFPELGVTAADCHEMTWLRAMAFIGLSDPNAPVEGLLKRTNNLGTYVKNKSDYVRRAIGKAGWESIFQQHLSRNGPGLMILEPHGGFAGRVIPDDMTPYPHRQGVLYNIQYVVFWWGEANGTAAAAATGWLGGLYGFMERFVTSNPREAFANYRDLEIGQNVVGGDGVTTYDSGRVWGEKYFMGNFRRLVAVKGRVDPGDYFRNEQSIPPLLQ